MYVRGCAVKNVPKITIPSMRPAGIRATLRAFATPPLSARPSEIFPTIFPPFTTPLPPLLTPPEPPFRLDGYGSSLREL